MTVERPTIMSPERAKSLGTIMVHVQDDALYIWILTNKFGMT